LQANEEQGAFKSLIPPASIGNERFNRFRKEACQVYSALNLGIPIYYQGRSICNLKDLG
jgi:hypothetical protein